MYDCQHDSYTGFSVNTPSPAFLPVLTGSLTALAHDASASANLDELAVFAAGEGWSVSRQPLSLTIQGVSLQAALQINHRFGRHLVISCALRREPPATFG